MSVAGVFKLLINDGKADRMILATKLLYQRIQDIMYIRSRQGRDDITPTLADLERTHIIFVNAHFKPFAAIGYEYNKVLGKGEFGASCQFSIPQFGDFFHDMVAKVTIDQAYGNTGLTPLQTLDNTIDQSTVIFPAGVTGNATTPNYTYNIVDFMGNLVVQGNLNLLGELITQPTQAYYRNLVKYCEYPANRLFQNVKFDVNGNPLDEYNYCIPMMLEKFTVPTTKRAGYNRLTGQQNPINGYSPPKANCAYDNVNNLLLIKSVANTGSSNNQTANLYQPTNTYSNLLYTNASQHLTKYNIQQSNQTIGLCTPPTNQTSLSFGIGENYGFPFIGQSTTANIPLLAANTAQSPILPTISGLDTFNNTSCLYNQYDIAQQQKVFVNGPQTAKVIQPPLEIWNKLRFWFCEDVRLSIPSVSIPFGQRFITIDLTTIDNLLFESSSIYLESTNNVQSLTNLVGFFDENNNFNINMLQNICNVTINYLTFFKAVGSTPSKGYANACMDLINKVLDSINQYLLSSTIQNAFTIIDNLDNSINYFYIANAVFLDDDSINNLIVYADFQGSIGIFQGLFDYYIQHVQYYTYKSYTPIYQSFGINTPNILNFELYINNIFVNPEVHDIFIKRIGFALIRVYRQQQTTINQHGLNSILLSSLKWPIEFMLIGLQPIWNLTHPTTSNGFITSGNMNIWRDWHRMTQEIEVNPTNASLANNLLGGSTINQVGSDSYFISVATIDSLSVVSHNIKIYDSFKDTFFTTYTPYHYGPSTIITPDDIGAFMINFSLFPASYQPSGHLNISRARETYLKFYSSYATGNTPCNLMIGAVCINFILISDGSAILRYST